MHKEQIKSTTISDKGGAGLGLIDIIRKTGEKYAYQFLRLDENYHFFVLKTTIPLNSGVITSYSIHYTKLYDVQPWAGA